MADIWLGSNKGSVLTAGQYLSSSNNDYLVSDNGMYYAIMNGDGNFVVYNGTDPSHNLGYIWSISKTALPTGPYFAIMQDDSNFVVYHGTGPSNNQGFVWDANTGSGFVSRFEKQLSIVSGNNQSRPDGFFAPLNVQVVYTATGQPVSGAVVHAYCSQHPQPMTVQFTNDGAAYADVTTDSNGIATFNTMNGKSMMAYNSFGSFTVTVTTANGNQLTFNEDFPV